MSESQYIVRSSIAKNAYHSVIILDILKAEKLMIGKETVEKP
jgi:hypothetical protein